MIRNAVFIAILVILIFFACTVDMLYARPVSYKGGWVLDAKADIDSYWALVNYTPERWYSVGQRTEVFKDGWVFTGGQLNILAKRWNHQDWQANIFLKSGTGLATTTYKGRNKLDAAVFTGGSIDWENRRFYIMYENRFMYAGGIECFFEQKIRPGIAPYIGDYGDIHTWLMVDVKYKIYRDREPEFEVVPLVRFFKGPLMAEAGASVTGVVYFSWTMLF
jgi:hypothetical protein